MKKRVYLDNAATTQIDKSIIDLMLNLMNNDYGNPSSQHSLGRTTRSIIETSRKSISSILNTSPGNIFFTSGGTEADNMAIKCGIYNYDIKHAITTRTAHHAVLYPLEDLAKKGDIELSYVDVNSNGEVCLDNLDQILKNKPRSFVSIMHANNEIGTIQDIKKIGDVCSQYDAIFHSDTVQTVGHYLIDLIDINVHFITASAHKFHGPKGIGFLYISDNISVDPLILGGSQERNMRAGTENLYGIAGMSKAMEIAYSNLTEDKKYISSVKGYMITELEKNIKGIEFFGNSNKLDDSLYTVLSCKFPENKNSEMLLFNLDINGISCSGGSACTSGTNKGSHVLKIIDPKNNRQGIRFSFSKYNTKDDIDYVINKLKTLIS
tara:strand:- start:3986 stop:5122 length:1137 start_codon:yes stop_codon:yes gene_type:complete